MRAEGIRDDAYAFGSAGNGECYVLARERPGEWCVYYSERGRQTSKQVFKNLKSAQGELLRRLLDDPSTRRPYRVERIREERERFGSYRYRIVAGDDDEVAEYWHDFRGDEHGLRLETGDDFLAGFRMTDFLMGGGTQPLTLSPRAIDYLDKIRQERSRKRPGRGGEQAVERMDEHDVVDVDE